MYLFIYLGENISLFFFIFTFAQVWSPTEMNAIFPLMVDGTERGGRWRVNPSPRPKKIILIEKFYHLFSLFYTTRNKFVAILGSKIFSFPLSRRKQVILSRLRICYYLTHGHILRGEVSPWWCITIFLVNCSLS